MRVALVGMQVAEHESESVGQKYICSLFVHEDNPIKLLAACCFWPQEIH